MTVIRPNGISGITSITSSGDAINFYKSDGTLGPVLGLNINATTGISTFAALNVTGVLTYEDVTSVDSVGIITARSDLSIADKIIHTGDTNTAIRFPAADTITAETSGSERLRIDGSGRVMIGNTVASSFTGNSSDNLVVGSGSGGEGITVYSATDNQGSITFADGTSGNAAYRGAVEYNHTADRLAFRTAGTGNRLIIDSSGRLLSGTTTEGHADADDLTLQAPSGYTGITLRSGTTTGGAIYFSDATSGNAELDGQIVYSQNSRTMTFATAGTTKLTLKSDGLLVPRGIQVTQNVTPTSGNGVEIFAATSSIGQIQAIDRDNSQWNDFRIKGQTIQIYTNNSESLRIDSSGRMGLGTASPTDHGGYGGTLEISGSPGGALYLKSGSDVGQLGMNSSGLQLRTRSAKDILFTTNNSERMRIDTSGRLLVNTSTSRIVEDHVGNGPQGKIQIEATNSDAIMSIISAGTADANRCGTLSLGRHRNSTVGATPTIVQDNDSLGAIVFAGGDGNDMRSTAAKIHAEVDGTPGQNDMPGALVFSTTPDGSASPYNQSRMRIDSSGHVQIGATTSDSFRLKVLNGAGTLARFTDGTSQTLDIRQATGGIELQNPNNGFISFKGSSAERMRITSSGAVGINRTSPTRALEVYDGQSSVNTVLRIGTSSVSSTANGYAQIEFKHGSGSSCWIWHNANSTTAQGGANSLNFYNSNAANYTFSSGGSNEKLRIQHAGGISFNGDTAQANALDDYEEGSFTPTANDGVYGTAVGSYVKIGSQVTVSGYVSTPSVTTGSTVIKIRSLPFPIASGHYSNGTGLYRYLSVSANHEIVLYVSGSDIEVWQSGTGNYSQLDHSDFNNSGAQIFFTVTYKTN